MVSTYEACFRHHFPDSAPTWDDGEREAVPAGRRRPRSPRGGGLVGSSCLARGGTAPGGSIGFEGGLGIPETGPARGTGGSNY